jgi:hypothetical protein
MFPIILTELRSYPQFVKDNFRLTHFTKYDLDAAQCLGMIIYILNHLLASIIERKCTGRVSQKAADLIKLMDFSSFKRLNFVEMYIMTKRIHWLTSQTLDNMRAFFSKIRPSPTSETEESSLLFAGDEPSKYTLTYSLLDSKGKDPQERSIRKEYLGRYFAIRSLLSIDTVKLAVTNFHNFVLLSQILKACNPEGGKQGYFLKPEECRLLACRIHKREDGTFYRVNLYLHVNMSVTSGH